MYDHCMHVLCYDIKFEPLVMVTPPKPSLHTGTGVCCKCGEMFKFKEHGVRDCLHGEHFNLVNVYKEWEYMVPDCVVKPLHLSDSIKPVEFREEDFLPGTLIITYMNKLCKVLSLSKNKALVHLLALDDTQCSFYEMVDNLCNHGYRVYSKP